MTQVPSVPERIERLLLIIDRATTHPGESVKIDSQDHSLLAAIAASQGKEMEEVFYFSAALRDTGLIRLDGLMGTVDYAEITPLGFARLLELRERSSASDQAFVAMWFSKEMDQVYIDGIAPGISDAGYRPLRIDRKEHNNKIDDEIIAEVRRSRFLVADFTSEPQKPRGGVYFEAGFAKGLGKEVIWSCRADCIEHVHFDTRQYSHIVWNSAAELRSALSKRISAVLGDGPLRGQS
jgi:nucleoside 2-deoxyribosyltransferase